MVMVIGGKGGFSISIFFDGDPELCFFAVNLSFKL